MPLPNQSLPHHESPSQVIREEQAIKDHVLGVLAPHNTWTGEQKIQIHAGYVAMCE